MITVKSQAEFEAAIGKNEKIIVEGFVATLDGNSHATLYGNSQATLDGNSHATLYGNSQATLYGYSHATLYGNSQATLYDYSQATLYDYSHATLYDNSHAELWQRAIAIIHNQYAKTITHHAAKIVYNYADDYTITVDDYIAMMGLEHTETTCILYKSVNPVTFCDFYTNRTHYTGEVTCLDFDPDPMRECGGGLHLSPTPEKALSYNQGLVLRCEVKKEDIAIYKENLSKVRCRAVKVIGEVK